MSRSIVRCIGVGVVVVVLGLAAQGRAAGEASPPAALPAEVERELQSADLIYVATQRRSGERSTSKPIWFFYRGNGELFFTTSPQSWKAKRIGRGSPLFIHVGRADGPALTGTPREVTDAALIDGMGEAYAKKYWIAWLGLFKPRSGRVLGGDTKAYLVSLRVE